MKRAERDTRRRQLERLRFLAELVCDSNNRHDDGVVSEKLDTMMRIILEVRPRRMNDQTREAFATHMQDCGYYGEPTVMLGGTGDKDMITLDGAFNMDKLAERLIWTTNVEGATVLDKAGRRINDPYQPEF